MAVPLSADANLSTGQFRDLNREFYEADPADYFGRRVQSLLLSVGDAPGLDQVLPNGVRYDSTEIRKDAAGRDQNADDAYAALEATNLLHHTAECFLRLYLAHATREPCPWLEIARLRIPREFKADVESLRDALNDPATLASLQHIFFGNSDPAALGWTIQPDEWQRKIDGLAMLVNHLCDTVLGDAAMYNATKHFLAAVGGNHGLQLTSPDEEISSPMERARSSLMVCAPSPSDEQRCYADASDDHDRMADFPYVTRFAGP